MKAKIKGKRKSIKYIFDSQTHDQDTIFNIYKIYKNSWWIDWPSYYLAR